MVKMYEKIIWKFDLLVRYTNIILTIHIIFKFQLLGYTGIMESVNIK